MEAVNRKLKGTLLWVAALALWMGGLSLYKDALVSALARDGLATIRAQNSKVQALFQASYYFFFDDQFAPGIRAILDSDKERVRIGRIRILAGKEAQGGAIGDVIFDSRNLGSGAPASAVAPGAPATALGGSEALPPAIVDALRGTSKVDEAFVFSGGFSVHLLVPGASQAVLYSLDGRGVQIRLGIAAFAGLLFLGSAWFFFRGQRWSRMRQWVSLRIARHWRLQPKMLAGILLINVIGGAVVYVSLVTMQTRDQTERIEKESVLFTQFSTPELVNDFTNFFYFHYNERFVPEVRRIIASNENLIRIRIVSRRTSQVLFDSEQAFLASSSDEVKAQLKEAPKADFSEELVEQLKVRDLGSTRIERDAERVLAVVNTYRNENQEPLFWVECQFSYQTLKKSIAAIRRQILLDFLPSMTIGLLLAFVFARFMIAPIRRLRDALTKVSAGDYDVAVEQNRTDEIGELVGAFNTMAGELKKKKELRKYLSDSTYRQIMEAPDSPEGVKIGGTRVSATVLFCDIRNFVRHCENLDAEEITTMLNEYFSEMVEVVYKYGGEVDKFIGDAFLAVFYASDEAKTIRPTEGPGDRKYHATASSTALQAIYCAMEMRERLIDYNQRRKQAHKEMIEIGVGISYGELISGPIGAKDRMDFTVIGDVVNLASRIEKLSKLGTFTKIVFSNHIEEKVRGLLEYHELSKEKIRGKEEEVLVYELIGIRDIEVLVENLRSRDKDLKRRSIDLLGQSRNPIAIDHVVKAMKDSDEGIQVAGMISIGKLAQRNDDRALDALFDVIEGSRSEKVISAGIATIGRLCSNDRVFALIPFLESKYDRVVANAVEAIGQVRNPKATDLILPLLNSRNNRVKANAAMAVFASGHIEVIDSLKPMLMHSEPLMRSSAAFAIGELTQIAARQQFLDRLRTEPGPVKIFLAEIQECVPMLVALLKDADPMVKRQAVIALGKIKDKTAVLPIIEMIDPNSAGSKELLEDVAQALRSIGSHSLVREVIARLSSK